jgi:hypothetical protein
MSNFYQYPPQQPGMGPSAVPYQQPNQGYPNQQQTQGNNFPGQEYLNFSKNPSPEVLQFGLNIGKQLIQNQSDAWLPGVSGFWLSLKPYFAVSVAYSELAHLCVTMVFFKI